MNDMAKQIAPEISPPLPTDNIWRCGDCGRIRSCPYAPMHMSWLIGFTLCSCGDACIQNETEKSAAKAALALAISKHLI
jgi:hypothetical protein